MRRIKIIGTAVCAVLLAAAAVVLIWFPGLITCLRMKWKYDNIDREVPQYETVFVPADFQHIELRGLSVSVPADYTCKKNSTAALSGPDGKTRLFVSSPGKSLDLVKELNPDYDPLAAYDFTETDLRQYFQTVGRPYCSTVTNALLFYCKDELSVWDGLRLRGSDRKVFAELCETKDGSWETEDTEKMTVPGGIAYISSGYLTDGGKTVTLLPDAGDGNLFVMVRETDFQKARQIISSMTFAGTGSAGLQ